ncbi:CPBP family intramembrane glutamic endopeptidase [Fervidibacillus halotolerans]|uniref:CPBP family intramembrane metalloprotease n=1 Tax=Fervidibacillus halotolerans TaxID=2980027 RepID=A0A9E8S1T6_9BACI|nr:CPBP family intramembrane glutamic endopeptidase [Fervidibacillus halotolerans]WAA13847.1 CPBP family intramembrane metalloprotease [Fervidibacillus halotolerans]
MEKLLKRKFGTTDKYVLSLLIVCLISSIAYMDVYFFIIVGISLLAVVQVFIETKSLTFVHTEILKKKFLISSLIVIPILEEFIFRYMIFHLLVDQGVPNYFYILLSSLTFTFLHYYKLKEKSFYKFILGLILSLVFLWTENLFITIYIHVLFNVLVYLIKYTEFYRGFE